MNQNPSYGAYIPAPVRYDKRIPPAVKLLYGEITALSNAEGYCWAGNQYFASLYDVDKKTVSAWISQLQRFGYIKVVLDKAAGNDRRIYLAEALLNTQTGYTENNGYLSIKSRIPIHDKTNTYPQKNGYNIITNNKPNNISSNEEYTRMNALSDSGGNSVGLDSKIENVEEPQLPKQTSTKKPNCSKSIAATSNLVLTSCKFPEHWTDAMKELYAAKWIPFRQKVARKLLLLESAQAQIEKLADLTEGQLIACINDSIANGWAGLFPDKYVQCANEQPSRTTSGRSGYQAEETKAKTPQIQQSGVVR